MNTFLLQQTHHSFNLHNHHIFQLHLNITSIFGVAKPCFPPPAPRLPHYKDMKKNLEGQAFPKRGCDRFFLSKMWVCVDLTGYVYRKNLLWGKKTPVRPVPSGPVQSPPPSPHPPSPGGDIREGSSPNIGKNP